MKHFDLAVIGGGPAGTSAAISVARAGHRVLLLERGTFPRQKVCGEFVSAEALGLLRSLVGVEYLGGQAAIKIRQARIFTDGKIRETKVDPPAHSIPRFAMDLELWLAAKRHGVIAIEAAAVKEINTEQHFNILTENGSFTARAVVNASGRWSHLNSELATVDANASIGLKRHFREAAPSQSVDLYFFPGGYCGVQPAGEQQVNVSAMVSSTVAKTLEAVFPLSPDLLARSSGWQPVTQQVATFPLIFRRPSPVGSNQMLNVGDAAGFIDPFVGDGISMALHSGHIAADCLRPFLRGEYSLERATQDYVERYSQQLLPAFGNAARLRKLLSSAKLRGIAMELLRFPAISEFALRSTRARIA